MEYNELRSLYGGLTGFKGLQRVNLSHNLLESITADDITGLDDLLILDISHNHLTTLDGTAQVSQETYSVSRAAEIPLRPLKLNAKN